MNDKCVSRIKEFRQQYGLPQQKVVDIIGMPKRTLENWEEGIRTPPEWMENLILEKLYRETFDQLERLRNYDSVLANPSQVARK